MYDFKVVYVKSFNSYQIVALPLIFHSYKMPVKKVFPYAQLQLYIVDYLIIENRKRKKTTSPISYTYKFLLLLLV